MANELELNELRERIEKLDTGAQICLLELVLADNRLRRKDLQAELLAAEAAQRERLRNQAEARRTAT